MNAVLNGQQRRLVSLAERIPAGGEGLEAVLDNYVTTAEDLVLSGVVATWCRDCGEPFMARVDGVRFSPIFTLATGFTRPGFHNLVCAIVSGPELRCHACGVSA